jgi:hypothetical protein
MNHLPKLTFEVADVRQVAHVLIARLNHDIPDVIQVIRIRAKSEGPLHRLRAEEAEPGT